MPFRAEKYRALVSTAALVKRVGFKRADEILGFLDDWRQFLIVHEREPESFQEYCRWTRRFSPRTANARLALLRSAFPEAGPQATPTLFLEGVLDRIRRELEEAE